MADKGKGSTSAADKGSGLSLTRDSVCGILLRLSASDVHRCRFVSHEWEALANDEHLIANYRRTRSPMPLFLSRSRQGQLRVDGREEGGYVFPTDLNAVDIVTLESRCLLRSSDVLQASPDDEATDDELWDDDQRELSRFDSRNQMYKVHGTCDGVILLSIVSQLVAYNPFTRHWGHLPPLHDVTVDGNNGSGILAFYASDDSVGGQSRELRILYRARDGYHIHILGGRGYRLVDPFAPGMPPECNPGGAAYMRSPVKHGGCLYWFPNFSLSMKKYKIVLFDTKAEKFSWIATPFDHIEHDRWTAIQLLKFQEGLAIATVSHPTSWTDAPIELWVLSDNDGRSWSHKDTIPQPMENLVYADDYDDQTIPPVFLLSEAQGILLPCPQVLVHCDRNWSVLGRYTRTDHWVIGLSHAIEESFKLHSFLDHNYEEPPFVFLFDDSPTDSEEGTEDNAEDDDNNDSESGGDDSDDDDAGDSSGGEDEDNSTEDEDDGEDVQHNSEDYSYSDDDSKDMTAVIMRISHLPRGRNDLSVSSYTIWPAFFTSI